MTPLWTRRDFFAHSGTSVVAACAAATAVTATAAAASARTANSATAASSAESLYDRAFVLDANTIASIGLLCCDKDTDGALKIMRDSGISVVKSTLGASSGTFEETIADIAAAQNLVDRFPQDFYKVNGADDLERAKHDRRVGIIFSFEAVTMLGDKIDRIELFRQFGVRVMQLSYNHKSAFGCGCLDGDQEGLTDLGHQAISKMNALGIALDLSHANSATTAGGIVASTKPPLITHAGCRAVYAHPRNKEDREMKAMADKGGVMGIYMLPFLTEDTRQPMLTDYMRHMTHALDVCGEDHVGIGTDVPFFKVEDADLREMTKDEERRKAAGVSAPGENRPPYIPDLNSPRKLEKVGEALVKQGYSSRIADKVLGLNFLRAFKEIWTT